MNSRGILSSRGIVVWVIALFSLTVLGALHFIFGRLDPSSDFSPAVLLIGYAPTLAALGVAGLLPGGGGIRPLWRQLSTWRIGWRWYAWALLAPLVLIPIGDLAYMIFEGASPSRWLALPSAGAATAMIGPLIAGGLGEEIGWRGFAQPRLQRRYGAIVAGVIIGVVWATWHLWPAIVPAGRAQLTSVDVIQAYVRLIATAVLYGWLYNRTRGGLVLAMVAHCGHNIAIDLLPPAVGDAPEVALTIALLYLTTAVVVIGLGRRHPVRGRSHIADAREVASPMNPSSG